MTSTPPDTPPAFVYNPPPSSSQQQPDNDDVSVSTAMAAAQTSALPESSLQFETAAQQTNAGGGRGANRSGPASNYNDAGNPQYESPVDEGGDRVQAKFREFLSEFDLILNVPPQEEEEEEEDDNTLRLKSCTTLHKNDGSIGKRYKPYQLQAYDLYDSLTTSTSSLQTPLTTLFVDYTHLLSYSTDLGDAIQQEYERMEYYLRESLRDFMDDLFPNLYALLGARDSSNSWFPCVGFYNIPAAHRYPIRGLRMQTLGSLVSVTGTITRTTDVRPELLYATPPLLSTDLGDAIQMEYERMEYYLRESLRDFMDDLFPNLYALLGARDSSNSWFPCVGFYNIPAVHRYPIRGLRMQTLGSLVSVTGTITRTTDVRPELLYATYLCSLCGLSSPPLHQEYCLTKPLICQNTQCRSAGTPEWILDRGNSTFLDWQKLRVQETSEEIPAGSMPRCMDVVVRNNHTDVCKPGDVVTLTG
eukprot:CAMPEP_0194395810 /NCGR_PEP_ID=MMETSP0174-20130528/124631_1 /TAXON_ID=216777 /ORGANISM="Proboscia alata, Strain PI-D3" /LENGTH=472 /DNA_ID=CAMNT_0039191787 /DNA_START=19 /DNA_END=1434 /DNA_ORIENTATION=+